jgi:hypothetical protein
MIEAAKELYTHFKQELNMAEWHYAYDPCTYTYNLVDPVQAAIDKAVEELR